MVVGLVVVFGAALFGTVVSALGVVVGAALVVCTTVVVGATVVTTRDGVATGGGGGAMTAGADVVGSADVVSTLAGVSSLFDAERTALTPTNQAIRTTAMTPPIAAERRRRLPASADSPSSSYSPVTGCATAVVTS